MNRRILKLAIPNVISNITIPLLGVVDLAVTGHMGSSVYVGAIAIGSMIFNLLYMAFTFLRMGSSGLTAQAYGARNFTQVYASLFRGLFVAICVSLLIIILQVPIAKLSFFLIDGSTEVETFARQYFYIRIWAAPATIGMYALTGWFIGMQNTKIPMVVSITINAINIGLNLLFVNVFHMKSEGIALGTVIAQYSGFLISIFFLLKYYRKIFRYRSLKSIFDKKELKKYFLVNRDIFIRTLSSLAVFTFFTSHSASTDNNILAANTLLLQFLLMFSYLTDGLAYAAEALCGKFYGAKDYQLLRQTIRKMFYFGMLVALIFTLLYAFFGNELLRILTNEKSILEVCATYKFWLVLIPLASFSSFIWDGIYIGLTASKQMRNSMLVSVFFVFFPIWFLFKDNYGNHALWLAFVLFFFTRGLMQTILFNSIRKEKLNNYKVLR